MSKETVAIIGSGVIGLTTGLELQKAGFSDIKIYTDRHFSKTTSAKAGAVFEPYHPGNMAQTEMLQFVRTGLDRYNKIIDQHPESETGIRRHDLYSVSTGRLVPENVPFLDAMPGYKLLLGWEVPGNGIYESAIVYNDVPFIDPTLALRYLAGEFEKTEGSVITTPSHKLDNLQEFVDAIDANIIVNASGLGARELTPDPEIKPMRGQIAVMNYRPKTMNSVLGDDGMYIFPRGSGELILGGTTELGEEVEQPDDETIHRIVAHAMLFLPDLQFSDLERSYAGLRPFRGPGAKVEIEDQPNRNKLVISSIGFGGSGWTFGYGAAEKVTHLVTGGHSFKVKSAA